MASENGTPSFSELPIEMILEIFNYLGHADRQAAGATCKHWYEALCHPAMNKNVKAKFFSINLSDDHDLVQSFIASKRPVRAFLFIRISMGIARDFLKKISTLARWVIFDEPNLTPNEFREMIREWKYLESLTICCIDTRYQYTPGDDLECEYVLENIKELSLQYVHHSFYDIVSSIRELRSFGLSNVSSFSKNFNLDNEIYSFNYFDLNILVPHLPHLRDLEFSQSLIKSSDLVRLNEKSDGRLKLEKFCLRCCTQLGTSLDTFLKTQPNLVYLNLADTKIKDDCIEIISECLPLLEYLNISLNSEISNSGAVTLRNLKYLKRLDLERCVSISDDGITQGIAAEENTTLCELKLRGLSISSAAIVAVAKNLKALRILNLSDNANAVDDQTVQIIIEYLPKLIELDLSGCKNITDTALTGISREKLAMIEQGHELNANERDGFGIDRLRGLQKLNLTYCDQITDITLKYGLILKELRELELYGCSKITFNGCSWLVQNCPQLRIISPRKFARKQGINYRSREIKNV